MDLRGSRSLGSSFWHTSKLAGVFFVVVSLTFVGPAIQPEAAAVDLSVTASETSVPIEFRSARIPNPPRSVRGVPRNNRVTVSWINPKSNRGLRVSRFTVTATPGGRSCSSVRGTSCTVRGLTNGRNYRFSVTAQNSRGTSKPSRLSPRITPRTVPSAPVSVVANPGDGQAAVSWAAPQSDGGARIRHYEVVSNPGNILCKAKVVQSCVVQGLTNGVEYTFTVTATNIAGASPASSSSSAITPRTVPGSPLDIEGEPGDARVTVTWKPPISDGGSAISSYEVVSTPGGFGCTTQVDTSCVVTGLTNGTVYDFTVAAINAAGPGSPGISEAVTPAAISAPPGGDGGGGGGFPPPGDPSPPPADEGIAGLSAPLVAAYNVSGTVWVTWNRPMMAGPITGFEAGISTSATGSPRVGSCETLGAQSCSVRNLTPGVTYYASVAPKVAGGTGQAMTSPQPSSLLQAGQIQFLNSVTAGPSLASARFEASSTAVLPAATCPSDDRYDYEAWSPDGRYMAFTSDSSILVDGDTNCATDVFVQDVLTGDIQRVSESSEGVEADTDVGIGGSVGSVAFWSPDGQWIAFWSNATTLVPGIDDSTNYHLYIKRISDGALYQVDTNEEGVSANASDGYYAYWSPDSSKIAFKSAATNLIPGDNFPLPAFYVKDLTSGSVTRVSEGTNGEQADSWVGEPPEGFTSHRQFWSADGSLVAFISGSDALVPGDTNGRGDVFVKNLETGVLTRASVDEFGNQFTGVDCTIQGGWSPFGNRLLFGCSGSLYVRDFDSGTLAALSDTNTNRPSWSPDGSQVAYVAVTSGIHGEVRVWNLSTDDTTLVASSTHRFGPVFSPDGSRIAYVGADSHMWIKNLATDSVTQVDTTEDGTSGDGGVNTTPKWSPDSTRLSFESTSTNLTSISGSFPYKLFIKTLPDAPVTGTVALPGDLAPGRAHHR